MPTETAVMTTQEVADRLSTYFKENKWMEAQQELFSDDIESIEPEHAKGMRHAKGMDEVRKKAEEFNSMVEEMHGGSAGEPIVAGNHIAVTMSMDATMKGIGRYKMDEIVVYEVKDGKIVKEQFFY